jgi:hypothetical protein
MEILGIYLTQGIMTVAAVSFLIWFRQDFLNLQNSKKSDWWISEDLVK